MDPMGMVKYQPKESFWAKTVLDAIFRLELNCRPLPLSRQIPGCFCLGKNLPIFRHWQRHKLYIPSLKLTALSHLKIDGKGRRDSVPFVKRLIFFRREPVSFFGKFQGGFEWHVLRELQQSIEGGCTFTSGSSCSELIQVWLLPAEKIRFWGLFFADFFKGRFMVDLNFFSRKKAMAEFAIYI